MHDICTDSCTLHQIWLRSPHYIRTSETHIVATHPGCRYGLKDSLPVFDDKTELTAHVVVLTCVAQDNAFCLEVGLVCSLTEKTPYRFTEKTRARMPRYSSRGCVAEDKPGVPSDEPVWEFFACPDNCLSPPPLARGERVGYFRIVHEHHDCNVLTGAEESM